jgi:hypothetical protein
MSSNATDTLQNEETIPSPSMNSTSALDDASDTEQEVENDGYNPMILDVSRDTK